VIEEVNQQPVSAPDDVSKAIDALKKAGKKSALMLVANGTGDVRFVALAIERRGKDYSSCTSREPLRIERRREVGMIDAGVGGRGDGRFGAIGRIPAVRLRSGSWAA
jgi:hypothetical protein